MLIGGLITHGINYRTQGFAIGHIAFEDVWVLQEAFTVDDHGQYHDADIVAFIFAVTKFGYFAPSHTPFKICIGQIVQDTFIFQIEQLIGAFWQVLF